MFSHLPPKQRVHVRISLSSAWAMSALGGAASLFTATTWPMDVLAFTGTLAGLVLTVMATLAALGVGLNRYRVEWVAAWFSAAALAPYALVYWYTVFSVSLGRLPSGFLLTALLGFYVTRAVMCSAHAERLRLLHEGETGNE